MANIVNEILYRELERDFRGMGSCLLIEFNKLTVEHDTGLRRKLREAGFEYRVVKNRLASKALQQTAKVDIAPALKGKCGIIFAKEARAIEAAKLIREALKAFKKEAPYRVVGAVIEGEAIVGAAASGIADMPDRNTVNAQLAGAISGPARKLATIVAALQSGLARCVQARVDDRSKTEAPAAG